MQDSGHGTRPLLFHTLRGPIHASVTVGADVRTMDHLNQCGRFIPVAIGETMNGDRLSVRAHSGISVSSVLFVTELECSFPTSDSRVEATHFGRHRVSLQVGDYEVQGFIHLPDLSSPLSRLNKTRSSFIAITAACVMGPEEFAAPFLAVNPDHIQTVHALQAGQPSATEIAATVAASDLRP